MTYIEPNKISFHREPSPPVRVQNSPLRTRVQEPLTDETTINVSPTPGNELVRNEPAVEIRRNADEGQDDYDYPPAPKRLTILIQEKIDLRSPSNPLCLDREVLEENDEDEKQIYVNTINHN